MVNRGTGPNGVKGSLKLDRDAVVFDPEEEGAADTRYRFRHVRRVRRVMGTPVLELHLQDPDAPPIVGFYFVKPPSLEAPEGPRLFRRRYARRVAVSKLRQWNVVKRDEVSVWVDRIKKALAKPAG